MHSGVLCEPSVVLGIVDVEVVENDVDVHVQMGSDDVVHSKASPALLERSDDLAGGHLECREQV